MLAGEFAEHARGCPTDPTARKLNGCDEDAPIPTFVIDGTEYRRCPRHYLTPDVLLVVTLWKERHRQQPISSAGVLDWPSTLLEALNVIDAEIDERTAAGVRE